MGPTTTYMDHTLSEGRGYTWAHVECHLGTKVGGRGGGPDSGRGRGQSVSLVGGATNCPYLPRSPLMLMLQLTVPTRPGLH